MTTTHADRKAAEKRYELTRKGFDEVDERFASSKWLVSALDKIFPDHWSFMVGEIAMDSLIILIVTGIYLALFFIPSSADVIYAPTSGNVYTPLVGQHMSAAYESVINLSFNVRFGLIMRQAHHWSALIFLAAIFFHMGRIFFTGAFRKPRETNWIIGLLLWQIVALEGFTGYSLPDDLLSGDGLRVIYSIVQTIPFIGPWLVYALWGGRFPGNVIIPRMFVIHEFLFPLIIVGLLSAHLAILWHQKHTDFPGEGKTETNIRGSRVWPQYAMKAGGLMMLTASVTFLLAGFVQINPVWLYGPFTSYTVSAGTQPDWYLGWQDGALRLWPHWEFRSFGFEVPNQFFPGLILPGVVLTILFAWPVLDRIIYKDKDRHNLLDRPRDKPFRTGVGVAGVIFFVVLTMATSVDIMGNNLHVSYERLIEILQIGVFVGPIVGFLIAYRTCLALQRTGAHPIQRPVGGIIYRTADGGYHTVGDVHANGHGDDGDADARQSGDHESPGSAQEGAKEPVAGD